MAKLLAENQGITEILSKGKLAFFFFLERKAFVKRKHWALVTKKG